MTYEDRVAIIPIDREDLIEGRNSVQIRGYSLYHVPDPAYPNDQALYHILWEYGIRPDSVGDYEIRKLAATRSYELYVEYRVAKMDWMKCLPKPVTSRSWYCRTPRQRFIESTKVL